MSEENLKSTPIEDTEDKDENENKMQEETTQEARKRDPNSGVMYYLVNNHLWIFAIWLVPISVLYDIFWWFRTRWTYWMFRRSVNCRHDEKVCYILI